MSEESRHATSSHEWITAVAETDGPVRRVLVTGGTGYLGRRLVPKLAADGLSIRCLVRSTSDEKIVGELKRAGKPKAEKLSVGIDFMGEFAASNQVAWDDEYLQSVQEAPLPLLCDMGEWFDDEIAPLEQWPVFQI